MIDNLNRLRSIIGDFKYCILVFTSQDCINCKHQRWIIGKGLPSHIKIVEVDVDTFNDLAVKYFITKVPTSVVVDVSTLQGLKMRTGVLSKNEINKLVGEINE